MWVCLMCKPCIGRCLNVINNKVLFLFRLHYDPSTKTFSNTEGVEIETRDFGNTSSVEFLDPSLDIEITNYFHDVVKRFSKLGYVRGETIRAAPYDWRFAPCKLFLVVHILQN